MSNKRQRTNNDKSELVGNTSSDVFEYTGNDQTVPKDVVSVRFHPSVTKVDNHAFSSCTELKKVVLNDGLQSIGSGAFEGCNSLQSINIPSTVTELGDMAFWGCSDLREVELNDGLKKIGEAAFANCTSLQSIAIPPTVTEIDNHSFNDCPSLREVVLNESRLTKIDTDVFRNCTALQSITIPSTVKEIDLCAFRSCTNLREIVLNEGVQRIGVSAFQDCTALQSITLPSTVNDIEHYAFAGQLFNRLREVVIYNEGVHIWETAFVNCPFLERFKFPRLSTRLNNIIQAGQRDIEGKMDDIHAVEWRGGELVIPPVRREEDDQLGRMRIIGVDEEKLNKVKKLVRYYETKEATTLFELALWKAGIDQTDISNPTDRGACRIEVPGSVKDTILQYL